MRLFTEHEKELFSSFTTSSLFAIKKSSSLVRWLYQEIGRSLTKRAQLSFRIVSFVQFVSHQALRSYHFQNFRKVWLKIFFVCIIVLFSSVLFFNRDFFPVGIYLLKVSNSSITRCEICPKFTRTPERRQWIYGQWCLYC